MGIELEDLCRGEGKVYARVALDGVDGCEQVRATSATKEGVPLPAEAVRTPSGDWVVVVAILDVEQVVAIEALDADGKLVAWAAHTVYPLLASIGSKVNGAIHSGRLVAVRNVDARPLADLAFVELDRIIVCDGTSGHEGQSIVRCRASVLVPADDEDAATCEVLISLLDARGRELNDGEWACLEDSCEPTDEDPRTLERTIVFSAYVPTGTPGFLASVSFAGGALPGGFAAIGASRVAEEEGAWNASFRASWREPGYDEWFRCQRISPRALELQRRASLGYRPLFSVITPLFRTDVGFFNAMVDSVLGQSYGNLELVLVNASPEDEELAAQVELRAQADPRVKVVTLEGNRGISLNTNAGIEVAAGDFLCFLDHDDVIEPDALYWYAKALNEQPDIDLLYCDEDKLFGDCYGDAFFKPDWDPDLMCGMNYVCHFLAVRATAVERIHLAGPEHDGAQDYHMTFAISEVARRVHHVPRVLYHWRIHEHSTASDPEEKPYTIDSARLCVEQHLQRCGIDARVDDSKRVYRRYEVVYALDSEPLVSIVVPASNRAGSLARCLASIAGKSTYGHYEVLVADRAGDGSAERELGQAFADPARGRVVPAGSCGSFSEVAAVAAAQAKGEYLLFLGEDVEVLTPEWIELLLGLCQRESTGAVGAKLLFADDTVCHVGIALQDGEAVFTNRNLPRRSFGYFESAQLTAHVDAVTAFCLMVGADDFVAAGGFAPGLDADEAGIDLCRKVADAGRSVVIEPRVELYEHAFRS